MDHALELTAWADNDGDAERATTMRLAAAEMRALRAELHRAQRACEQIATRNSELHEIILRLIAWEGPVELATPELGGLLRAMYEARASVGSGQPSGNPG